MRCASARRFIIFLVSVASEPWGNSFAWLSKLIKWDSRVSVWDVYVLVDCGEEFLA